MAGSAKFTKKNPKNKPNKKPENQKNCALSCAHGKKIHKENLGPEPNRTEPVITTTNSGGRLPATTSAKTSEADDALPATPAEFAPAAAPVLKLNLVGLIATPGGGIADNLVDKATKKNIKVKRLGQSQ